MTHAEALPIFVKLQDEPDSVHTFPEAINRVWQGDGVPFVTVVQTPVGEKLTITPRNTKMTKAEKKSRRRHGRTNPVQGVWIWAEKERK